MINDLLATPAAFWLALGGILLAVEMLGTAGYLLWSSIAAIITGILAWLLPIGWDIQGVCFALLTIIAAFVWWRWLNRPSSKPSENRLNQRGQQLIGQRLILDNALINGRGNVRLADSSWPVVADSDYPAGTVVTVIAIDGITLRVAVPEY